MVGRMLANPQGVQLGGVMTLLISNPFPSPFPPPPLLLFCLFALQPHPQFSSNARMHGGPLPLLPKATQLSSFGSEVGGSMQR